MPPGPSGQVKPTVSVCIPTYNGARYLAACLESVVSQTFSDVEILVVDDCSSDETVQIASAFARRDPRIRITVNEANLGLVGNWNRSAQLAGGEWIKFVFQDDVVRPECIAQMHAVAKDTKLPIISCGREFLFEEGTPEELREEYLKFGARTQAAFRSSSLWSAHDFCEAVLGSSMVWNILGEPTAVLLHRGVFERFGWFNPRFRMLCDFEYWGRVASNTGTVHIPEVLARFRVHENSTSGYFRKTKARRYRFGQIDPLLVVHEYAFHPHYAVLRGVAAGRRPRMDLVDEFWGRALVVLWFARDAARRRIPSDASLLEEWHCAARDWPRLASIPLQARILSKWRSLKRSVSRPRMAGGRPVSERDGHQRGQDGA
jgi:glycosyltransferase involved in cell wall biosynthesis